MDDTRGWRGSRITVAVAIAMYPLTVLLVMLLEYRSELDKIARGTFSDTFSPFAFTHLLTLPSSLIVDPWPGYPDAFDEAIFRRLLHEALPLELTTVALQSVVIAMAVLLVRHLLARW